MKNLKQFIINMKFRKIVKYYIIFAIIAILISSSILGYAYRDKIIFAYNYNNVSEKMENGKIDVNSITKDISKLANQSSDIVDILILDNNNKITYSAKNSKFNDRSEFKLNQKSYGDYIYFTYSKNTDITFKLMQKDELMLSTVWIDHDSQIQNIYRDNTFYKNNINVKKLYLLSYTFDKTTGTKIYFISDIHSIPYGPFYLQLVFAVLLLVGLLYWVLVALWVFRDAKKSKINYFLWAVIALFTNIAGLFIYLIYKQNNQICPHCHALQSKGNIHCIHCGIQLNSACKSCNTITGVNDIYCSHCGKKIEK